MTTRATQFADSQRAKNGSEPLISDGDPLPDANKPPEGEIDPITQGDDPVAAAPDAVVAEDAPPQSTEGDAVDADDTDTASDEEGAPEATVDPDELTDEELQSLVDVYEDKLLASDKVKARLDKLVKEQVDRQRDEFAQGQREQAEVATLLQNGDRAVQGMFGMLETAHGELAKAVREEEFSADGILDADKFGQYLRDYTGAVVAESDGRNSRTLDKVVMDTLQTLPALSDDQLGGIRTILNNAKRMQHDTDPNQQNAAFPYLLNSLVGFLLERTRESATTDERTRISSRPTVAKKVAVAARNKAAAAKLAAQRGVVAPVAAPSAKPESVSTEVSIENYERLKRAGKHKEAQEIVNKMGRYG